MKTSCPMSAVRVAGLRLALLGFVLAPLAAAEGQVWVLSRGGGFPQLPLDPQPVIDAAADGDVLLFETGV
ncbi:MAG TPA: hypothetical protein VK824_04950, partial [Planctomycetota bacterium]|nr:hypothetical protein [Planctomycetota bacterium]